MKRKTKENIKKGKFKQDETKKMKRRTKQKKINVKN